MESMKVVYESSPLQIREASVNLHGEGDAISILYERMTDTISLYGLFA